jgi:hypothetical protein
MENDREIKRNTPRTLEEDKDIFARGNHRRFYVENRPGAISKKNHSPFRHGIITHPVPKTDSRPESFESFGRAK